MVFERLFAASLNNRLRFVVISFKAENVCSMNNYSLEI